jgi:hypothetical protein
MGNSSTDKERFSLEAPADGVVATDTASVNADYDNGATLQGTLRLRGWDENADRRLATVANW